ncbi:hypothetical protein KC315_g5486 [Hortaea werneckii]|uniref:PRISE-like Rossmann-fold domain-containing protein n=1 Tax=Hortaea werneckii TaxID=91943 RepID=A0A3M7BX15_HORWE|nr:hypothetical protein KC315_g5486 [Hortaea werneckii]RMY44244.1 hypothetical protein D0865_10684 [Hortaea werneckii]RMY69821.1 hypothetical protein D0863_06220 [Hortaea werneckii]
MTAEESLLTIRSDGIYHGLPVFPENVGGLTAIITGANGISGTHMSPEQIARQLKEGDIKADYVFFFAYIQPSPAPGRSIWSAAEELVKVNKSLLSNFLQGLAGANAVPKRILLQLGAKYYGVHLGPTTIPQEESDARVLLEPNFYYDQEDYLKRFCEEHHCAWNTTRPSWVSGAAPDAAMNLVYPLAVYGAIQKHLNRPLVYPGDLKSWENLHVLSTATLNCYLAEWAVLTEVAANKSFNAGDDSPFSWGKFWPKFANYLGIAYAGPQIDTAGLVEEHSGQSTLPRGWGPVGTIRYRFKLADWAKRPEVSAAWKEIAEESNLQNKTLGDVDRVFGFIDAAILNSWPTSYSNTELRKNGFFGFVDSTESIFKVVEEFVGLDMLPGYFLG